MSDHIGLMRRGALGLIVVLTVTLLVAPAAGHAQARDRDCSLPPTGKTPLTDLGADTYLGAQGGLYPQGANTAPDSHLAVGLARASLIQPLDAAGEPDPDGVIGFASIGFSNPQREFEEFEPLVPQTPGLEPSFRAVNLAQGGQHILIWASPGTRPWQNIPMFLDRAGVTAAQIQAVWLKQTQRVGTVPDRPFPENALFFRDKMIEVVTSLQQEFPNLQVVYISSRGYGGWNDVSSPSPEPIAYEEGFGVKWLIEEQIAGNPILNADPAANDVVAPWLAWGPYLWADGTNPRSDGLTWSCDEFRASDGAHLDDAGNTKVAGMLMDFLQSEPTAAWAFTDRELPDSPEDAVPPPTSTIPGVVDSTPTTSSPAEAGRDRERVRGTTTTTPPPPTTEGTTVTTTTAPVAAPPPQERENDELPPLVWVLIGAGGAVLAIGSGTALYLTRTRRGAGASSAGEPPP